MWNFFRRFFKAQDVTDTPTRSDSEPRSRDYDIAMRRLVYLAAFGSLLIVAYALSPVRAESFRIAAVGLLAGWAALVTGGLMGFLFGVPYAREASQSGPETHAEGGSGSPPDERARGRYRPNSNLEQVSDWLTKIIVGVGLIQFNSILAKLWEVAGHLATGLGEPTAPALASAQAFASSILIYFAVCGFVFGFLWARLYLLRWFTHAEDVRELKRTVNRLEEQQQADAKALALAIRQLSRASDEPLAPDSEVATAIKAASPSARAQIFGGAADAADRADAGDRILDGVISVMRALIASDEREIFHQNHAQLSLAMGRKQPPDLDAALKAISRAIEIRNALGLRGWRVYDFHRARCRIERDSDFRAQQQSAVNVRDEIVADLRVASSHIDKWNKWVADTPTVTEWMQLNGVRVEDLRAP